MLLVRLEGAPEMVLAFNGTPTAIMRSPKFYAHRKEERCARTFGTTDDKHPMIKVGKAHPTLPRHQFMSFSFHKTCF